MLGWICVGKGLRTQVLLETGQVRTVQGEWKYRPEQVLRMASVSFYPSAARHLFPVYLSGGLCAFVFLSASASVVHSLLVREGGAE